MKLELTVEWRKDSFSGHHVLYVGGMACYVITDAQMRAVPQGQVEHVKSYLERMSIDGVRRSLGSGRNPGASYNTRHNALNAAVAPFTGDAKRAYPSLETKPQAETIRAWKWARLHVSYVPASPVVQRVGKVEFAGIGMGTNHFYGTYAEAICANRSNHKETVPSLTCTCGFYAVPRGYLMPRSMLHSVGALLEVELYGKVIVHEYGYRAQKQRVLSAQVIPAYGGFVSDMREILQTEVSVLDWTVGA